MIDNDRLYFRFHVFTCLQNKMLPINILTIRHNFLNFPDSCAYPVEKRKTLLEHFFFCPLCNDQLKTQFSPSAIHFSTDAVGLNKNSSEVETPMASLEEHTMVDDLPRKISDDEDDKENLT